MIPTFSSRLRQLRRFSAISQSVHSDCNKCKIADNFLIKNQVYGITSEGNFVRSLSLTNQTNCYSTKMNDLNVDYEEVVKAQKDQSVLIIDVREDSEIQETGKLPGSIHIPMGEVPSTLTNLSDSEFEKKFNRRKPTEDTKIILSCRSGKRSAMVQSEMFKLGYKKAYNYSGGWLDWECHQKS